MNNQKHWCLLSMKCNSVYTTYTLCYTANTWVYTIYTSVYIEYTSIIYTVPSNRPFQGWFAFEVVPVILLRQLPLLLTHSTLIVQHLLAINSSCQYLVFSSSEYGAQKWRFRKEVTTFQPHRFRVKVVKFEDLLYPYRFVAQIWSKVGWGKKMRNQQLFLANKRKRKLTLHFFLISWAGCKLQCAFPFMW